VDLEVDGLEAGPEQSPRAVQQQQQVQPKGDEPTSWQPCYPPPGRIATLAGEK
jgi:hypothetical protein